MKMTKSSFFNVLDKNIKQHLTAFDCILITEDDMSKNGVTILLKIKGQSSLNRTHLKIRAVLLNGRTYSLFEDLASECVLTAYDLQQLVNFARAIKKELEGGFINA